MATNQGEFAFGQSLKDAKAETFARLEAEGEAVCPLCSRLMKQYRRRLPCVGCAELIKLYRVSERSPDRYYHRREFMIPETGGGDFAKLRYWGLVEPSIAEPEPEKKHNGEWRLTERGRSFAMGQLRCREYAIVYDGEFREYAGGELTIYQALGKAFDYSELMGARPPWQ